MKSVITSDSSVTFKPITIQLVIEDENEARLLWHLFNLSKDKINTVLHSSMMPVVDSMDYDTWDKLDDIIKERKIRVRKYEK
jgi:hypothetical protein